MEDGEEEEKGEKVEEEYSRRKEGKKKEGGRKADIAQKCLQGQGLLPHSHPPPALAM